MAGFVRELKADFRSRVPLVIWVLVSLAVGVAGPFGSYGQMSLAERLLFWAPVLAIGIAVSTVIRAFVYGWLNLHGRLSGPFLATALICLVLCPPLYVLVHVLFANASAGIPSLGELVLLLASVSLGVCAVRESVRPTLPALAEGDPVSDPLGSRLIRRLDPALQGDLIALTVRDHYVEVTTTTGSTSLLMRLSDAIAEAEPVEGVQVHRSHWVAWDAVDRVEREAGKLMLVLRTGQKVPVSRANRAKVEERFGEEPASSAA